MPQSFLTILKRSNSIVYAVKNGATVSLFIDLLLRIIGTTGTQESNIDDAADILHKEGIPVICRGVPVIPAEPEGIFAEFWR